ncbi:hypothetical protein ABE202_17740 [Bacillus subtilis]|uniref:hypothetical protein n=1 Tax=Bacillus subtilis TaxID=1423 RepID=UPI00227ED1FA|nr:hypothetical protein [Bacillus subtilis]MCY8930462.1 hypothetical protein [Bacillus subtilis]
MRLSPASLLKLSEMICGNEPFTYFPYRSSSYLTKFFVGLELDYIHDGSTRSSWVHSVLVELSGQPNSNKNMPSKEIVKVIEQLLHPDYFLFDDSSDLGKAREAVKQMLKLNSLTLSEQPTGLVKVVPLNGEFISTEYSEVPSEKLITFRPSVFQVPDKPQQDKLISVMMPFNTGFNETYEAIKRVTEHMRLDCKRADDIWDNSTIMQDIFDLLFCAKVIIVDFSGRNPNVMYETGIAHALGKQIIPITQSIDDIPSDLGHHRALKYYPNEQGYKDLSNNLYKRLRVIFNEQLT